MFICIFHSSTVSESAFTVSSSSRSTSTWTEPFNASFPVFGTSFVGSFVTWISTYSLVCETMSPSVASESGACVTKVDLMLCCPASIFTVDQRIPQTWETFRRFSSLKPQMKAPPPL
ncbi:hypothetical protein M758_UG163400 [Ceratodon purpureus]|nr:hypothetical protein M758_UG163400 [Ceratodon purpureus]